MRKLALAALLLSLPCVSRAADPWRATDVVLEATSMALIAADWSQTLAFRRTGMDETNPLLGRQPSIRKVNLMIGTTLLLHPVVAHFLPRPLRILFQSATIALETDAVHHNHKIGVGFSTPW